MKFEVVIRGQNDNLLEMCQFFLPKDWSVRILKGTTQLSYFKEMLNTEYEWVINLDEDSFLINSNKIYDIIGYMKVNNIAYSGFLDGGQLEIRAANPVSMNPFFNVFNVKAIKEKINYDNYDETICTAIDELNSLVNYENEKIYRNIDLTKLSGRYTNCFVETYYPFFYFLYSHFKFHYFDARYYDKNINLDPAVRTMQDLTTILSFKGSDFVYHTWYARHYNAILYHTERINKMFNICRDFLDMKNMTFIIQYIYDHPDRLENLNHVIKHLKEVCPCANIFIYELGKERTLFNIEGIEYKFKKIKEGALWHRTKDFNDIIKIVNTPYIALFDCDVFFDFDSYYDAMEKLREHYSVVYPYNGTFTTIDRSYLKDGIIKELGTWNFEMFGGAVFFNRQDYINAGMENENLITYGIDDFERYDRLRILEYKIGRTNGVCYHLMHWRKDHVMDENNRYKENEAEWIKIREMNKDQLIEYVNTWQWTK